MAKGSVFSKHCSEVAVPLVNVASVPRSGKRFQCATKSELPFRGRGKCCCHDKVLIGSASLRQALSREENEQEARKAEECSWFDDKHVESRRLCRQLLLEIGLLSMKRERDEKGFLLYNCSRDFI